MGRGSFLSPRLPQHAPLKPPKVHCRHPSTYVPLLIIYCLFYLFLHNLIFYVVRLRIDELTRKIATGDCGEPNAIERSPSPEPMYNREGKRTNTREQRAKDKLVQERAKYILEAMKIDPLFRVC